MSAGRSLLRERTNAMLLSGTISAAVVQPTVLDGLLQKSLQLIRAIGGCWTIGGSVGQQQLQVLVARADRAAELVRWQRAPSGRGAGIRAPDAAEHGRRRSSRASDSVVASLPAHHGDDAKQRSAVIAEPAQIDGQVAREHPQLAGPCRARSAGSERILHEIVESPARWSSRSTSAWRPSHRTARRWRRAAAGSGRAAHRARRSPRDRGRSFSLLLVRSVIPPALETAFGSARPSQTMVATDHARVGESMRDDCAYRAEKLKLNHIVAAAAAHGKTPHSLARRHLRLSGLEPGARIHRLARFADLEIQLRPAAAAAVAGRGNRVSRADALADRLVEPLIVSIEAHVAVAMIDDGEQTRARAANRRR